MRRNLALSCTALAVACAALAPATAGASLGTVASAPSAATKPSITRVAPMRVKVGAKLTISGKRFRARPRGNTVVFRAGNGRTVFVKPLAVKRGRLVVKVSAPVARLLNVSDGRQRPTRLKLRVLAGKFSSYTPRRLSPVVVGLATGGGKKQLTVCNSDSDHDNDLLPNSLELEIKTDPCLADTDGDGMSDGWEYYAAKDLNVKAVPYPGKRPFPNPLDGSDAGIDFDGDVLTAEVEYRLWRFTGSSFDPARIGAAPGSPLGYSDGTQASRPEETPSVPAFRSPGLGLPFSPPAYPERYAMPHVGAYHDANWTDDERDADADGLNNYVEAVGPGTTGWWAAWLDKQDVDPWPEMYFGEFTQRPFANVDPVDPDVDGDSLLDGEDDQDNDDIPNYDEMYDPADLYGPTSLRKNAFNPCAPDEESRTCALYRPL